MKKKSYRRPSDLELELQKLILLIGIVSLFVEKSHRSPSHLETRIAHRCPKPKDTVTLGFVGHKSNLTGRERLALQSKNLFSDCEKDKKTGLVKLAYFPSSKGVKVAFG